MTTAKKGAATPEPFSRDANATPYPQDSIQKSARNQLPIRPSAWAGPDISASLDALRYAAWGGWEASMGFESLACAGALVMAQRRRQFVAMSLAS